jgi:hypothetical protein
MSHAIRTRRLGAVASVHRQARIVDRLVIHGAPVTFRELAARAIPEDARYLVLDLDRTVHLGRNIGELVGWELCARVAYGEEHLVRTESSHTPGRVRLDPGRPLATARYLAFGLRRWTYPGLFYLLWGKLASVSGRHRRQVFRRFGPDAVREVQSVPQTALLQQLATLPREMVHSLTRAVWKRFAGDMIFDRSDLEWLRGRCPRLQIVLSSASPTPVLEIAAAELGVDAFVGTDVDVSDDGRLSTPLSPRGAGLMVPGEPRRLCPPSRTRVNASYTKIERLLERFPDLLDEGVTTVGVSDNGYGEDGCFAEFFTRVIDVNSTQPYPPVVTVCSPVREVHSAAVLTRAEKEAAAGGVPWLDPRRPRVPTGSAREIERDVLEKLLSPILDALEHQARRYGDAAASMASSRDRASDDIAALHVRIDEVVDRYNRAEGFSRRVAFRHVRLLGQAFDRAQAAIRELERPLSEAAYEIAALLEGSRSRLDAPT